MLSISEEKLFSYPSLSWFDFKGIYLIRIFKLHNRIQDLLYRKDFSDYEVHNLIQLKYIYEKRVVLIDMEIAKDITVIDPVIVGF